MNFPFPYEPYPQQNGLMTAIYECIDNKSSGCFESPTGTGKSLSVICSALHWQRNEENRIINDINDNKKKIESINSNTDDDNNDWLLEWTSNYSITSNNDNKHKNDAYDKYEKMKTRISKASMNRPKPLAVKSGTFNISKQQENEQKQQQQEQDNEFMLPYYDSDDDKTNSNKNIDSDDDIDNDDNNNNDIDGIDTLEMPQIYYCSRTHTQIAQFVSEIKKTVFSDIRCVTLGSRKNFCINNDVSSLGSDSKISEICLEMQKKTKKDKDISNQDGGLIKKKQKVPGTSTRCSYRNKKNESEGSDHILGKLRDIEELVTLGKQLHACPYYTSRYASKSAQVVCMPYNVLLHKDLRTSMGIKLKGRVIIFDEAHNLIEAINHIHSADINVSHIQASRNAIDTYLKRFQCVLSGKNLYYVNLLKSVLVKLSVCLAKTAQSTENTDTITSSTSATTSTTTATTTDNTVKPKTQPIPSSTKFDSQILQANDFVFMHRLDNVNLFKLLKYTTETNLVNKIGGYADHQRNNDKIRIAYEDKGTKADSHHHDGKENTKVKIDQSEQLSILNSLRKVIAFLNCLNTADCDGKVVLGMESTEDPAIQVPSIKYVLMNPSIAFKDIVDNARSVILLGGTLQPFNYLKSFLFPHIIQEKVKTFACGHIVSPLNVKPIVILNGNSGNSIEFTHERRLAKEVHSFRSVPHGIVVFFTSYVYMNAIINKWSESSSTSSSRSTLMDDLKSIKSVFVEPKSANDCETVWNGYSQRALSDRGAALFCVMGGKLSEGINFSDNLARGVVVIGMPYPDRRDPVLREKLQFAERKESGSSKALYDALCMKVVNQSIGRSIRHINDYATILLVDRRYSQPKIIKQLPTWIQQSLMCFPLFPDAIKEIKTFFKDKKTIENTNTKINENK